MIYINTSSHVRAQDDNKKAFEKLNELLFSNKNPQSELFDGDILFLDDTNWFISIVPSSSLYYNENVSYEQIVEINNFIRRNLDKESKDINIYIWGDIFTK